MRLCRECRVARVRGGAVYCSDCDRALDWMHENREAEAEALARLEQLETPHRREHECPVCFDVMPCSRHDGPLYGDTRRLRR